MRRAVVALVCGCGRFGFDAQPDAGDGRGLDAYETSSYMAPSGADSNPGTRDLPWLTFSHALGSLQPGDRLTLLDGDYNVRSSIGKLDYACTPASNSCEGHMCASGAPGMPITIRADHERRAHLFGAPNVIHVAGCTDVEIDGLYAEGIDDVQVTPGEVIQIELSARITLSRILARHPNRNENNHVIEVDTSTQIDIGHTEVYDFHRAAFSAFHSHLVTFHDNYSNGRGYPDLPAYTSACPDGGDVSTLIYYADECNITNTVSEDACAAFSSETGVNPDVTPNNWGLGHQFVNDIAVGPGHVGFETVSACDPGNRCDGGPDRITTSNRFTNTVAIGFENGYILDGIDNHVDESTVLGTDVPNTAAVTFNIQQVNNGLAATAFVYQALVTHVTFGVISNNQTDWGATGLVVFATTTPYTPFDAHVSSPQSFDPALGGCQVYLPAGSLLETAGIGGSRIGADIRSLWTPGTGVLTSCGAVIAGVNDDAATSCIGVHTRLGVGSPCPLP